MATTEENAIFANLAYDGPTTNWASVTLPPGWKVLAQSPSSAHSYYGVAFQNTTTGEIAIANRGSTTTYDWLETDPSLSDADRAVVGNNIPLAFIDALSFAQSIAQANPGAQIDLTGHSVGGGEAQYQGAVLTQLGYNVSGETFAAPGVQWMDPTGTANMVNHVFALDPIGDATGLLTGSHIGTVDTILPNGLLQDSNAVIPFGLHGIDNYLEHYGATSYMSQNSGPTLGDLLAQAGVSGPDNSILVATLLDAGGTSAALGVDPSMFPAGFVSQLQQAASDGAPSLTALVGGIGIGLEALAAANGTAELVQAQAQLAANKALIDAMDNLVRSGLQDTSEFLSAVGTFLGRSLTTVATSAAELGAIAGNFGSDLSYLHVVQTGDTYNSIAQSLGMAAIDGQVLADLNRGQVGDFLTPGSVVLTPISVSTLGSQALSLTGGGGGQENVIDLRSGLMALMPLLGSDANTSATTVFGSNGGDLANLAAGDATTATLSGGVLTIGTSLGGTNGALDVNTADGSGQYLVGGTSQTSFGAGSVLDLTQGQLGIGKNYGANNLLSEYALGANGGLLGGSSTLSVAPSDNPGSLLAQQGLDANSLLSAANTGVGLDTPSGPAVNSLITNIDVSNLGTLPQGQLPFTTDPTGSVLNGLLLGGTDFQVIDPTVNDNGVFNNSPADILSAGSQPGNETVLPSSQDLIQLVGGEVAASAATGGFETNITVPAAFTDYSGQANNYLNIDPLVLDLTGNGISLSNWIDNSVYFQSNVTFNPTAGQATSDGKLHHTSWVNPGDGMLVLPVSGAVPDITDTLSEYFRGGQYHATTGQYTPWTDGLAALASLATAGAGTFSAATSLTDPATGQSYWSELRVWQDTNQNGTADPGELQSLTALGIASISLVGSGNSGESIAGSAVVNRTSYTNSAGTVGEVAAVDLSTDTTGDVFTTATGGVTITSTPEGGPTPTTSFVDQSTAPQSYTLSGGTLTDQTSGRNTVGTGLSAVFLTAQGGSITVSPTDTTSYWLGGGSGAGALSGGAGNTVFLVNAKTVVHGGSGFNIAEVTDTQPANIDLMKENLQEVIGGQGGGVFNASGTNWNVFIQATAGNNIIIGGAAYAALAGGTGNDLIEGGPGGSVIHAGSGNDVIYGGSGKNAQGQPNSDVIYGGPGHDTVELGTNNALVYAGSGPMTVIGNANGFSVVGFHGSYADYTLTHNADGSITVTDSVPGRDGAVTMQNVTALDFSDIAQVRIANASGMAVNDQLAVDNPAQVTVSGNSYVIQAATLLANDIDYSGKALSIRELLDNTGTPIARGGSGVVSGGVASLSADGSSITFTPIAGFDGAYSFRYHVVDSSGQDGTTVYQIGTKVNAEMSATVYLNTPSQPTDPLFDNEWFLSAVKAPAVWGSYTGAGVSVGIFDPSGNVDFTNPDLAANAGSEVKIDGTPGVETTGTHATLIAGVIGAAADGSGAVGVAPGVTLNSEAIGTATNATDTGAGTNNSNLMDWSKYDVVNNSFQSPPPFVAHYLSGSSELSDLDALQNAAQTGRGGLGTVVVFGGGNSRATGQTTNDFIETNSPYEITVGGIDAPSDLGSLQISGVPFSDPGASILVSAPANQITSTGVTYTTEFGQQFGANYQTAAGTSFATPIVAGVVALMLQANPNLTYRDVQTILAYTATLVDPTDTNPFAPGSAAGSGWFYNGAANWNGGGLHFSSDYGFGEVNALAAVRLAETWRPDTGVSVLTDLGTKANIALSAGTFTDMSYGTTLSGVRSSIEYVQITINITNVIRNNLTITLTSPDGTKSVLMDRPGSLVGAASDPADFTPQANFDYTFGTTEDHGEAYGTNWTLSIADASGATSTAVVTGWHVTVSGSPLVSSSSGQTYVYTDEFGNLTNDPSNAARSTLTSSGYGDTLNAAAVSTGSVIDLTPGSTDSFIAGRSLTIGTKATITTAYGGDGNDTMIAPTGSAVTLQGGRGDDTYQFNAGFGQDTVIDGWSTNSGPSGQVILGSGLDPGNLWLSQSGNDLLIQKLGTTSEITVKGWYANASAQLQDLTLVDGYQLTTSEIASLAAAGTAYQSANPGFNAQTATGLPSGFAWSWPAVIAGTSGNTNLTGTVGDDVFVPGPGNDTLTGNGGNDVYQFAAGDGQVAIVNGVSGNTGPTGELALPGLSWSQMWFAHVGNNLVVSRLGSTDTITIDNWFTNSYAAVGEVVFGDGTHLTTPQVDTLATAEGAYSGLFPAFNPSTASAVPWSLSFYQTIVSGSAIAGFAPDYYGSAQGQANLYVTGPTGQLETWSVTGQNIGAENVALADTSGAQSLVDPSATVIGSGQDFLGTGQRDVFLRYASGQLHMLPASSSGQATSDEAFTTASGAAMLVDTSTTVVGGGADFYRSGERTLFVRNGSGALSAWGVNASGAATDVQTFTYQGAAVPIDTATTVVGGGEDFLGWDQSDIFVRYSTGELRLWQATSAGVVTDAPWFTFQGASVPIDTSTTVVGGGEDFLGTGQNDIFVRYSTGELRLWQAISAGAITNAVWFTYQGAAVPIDTGTTVVGGGEDLLGAGQNDIFVRYSTGQLRLWQATSAGALTNAIWFTNQGAAFTIDTATTVVGVGQNIYAGAANHDLFLRLGSGDLLLVGYDNNGAEIDGAHLNYGNAPLSIDTASTVIGTGVDQTNGKPDFTVHDAYSGTTATYDVVLGSAPRGQAAVAMAPSSSAGGGGSSGSSGGTATVAVSTSSGGTTSLESNGSYLVIGTSGDDQLANSGASVTLVGNGGSDNYVFDNSNVTETIINGTRTTTSPAGTLQFIDSSTDTNLWFDQVDGTGAVTANGTDLRVSVLGTSRSVMIDNWFASGEPYARLSDILLKDGMTLSDAALPGLMQAMTGFEQDYATSHGGAAFNPSAANPRITDPGVLAAVGSAWQH